MNSSRERAVETSPDMLGGWLSTSSSKYIRLFRPVAWICFLLPFTVGLAIGSTTSVSLHYVLYGFISFIFSMVLAFTTNAIADRDVDRLHDGRAKDIDLSRQPIVTGEISILWGTIIVIISVLLSMLFAYMINPIFLVCMLVCNIMWILYSVPPTRFKARPVGDIFCNTVAGGTLFVAGLSIGGAYMDTLIIIGIFIMASIFYIPTAVTDYDFDKSAGLKTSAVYFTPKVIIRALYPLTGFFVIVWLAVMYMYNELELRIFALLVISYAIIYTVYANTHVVGTNLRMRVDKWVFIPFFFISILSILYALMKIFGFITF